MTNLLKSCLKIPPGLVLSTLSNSAVTQPKNGRNDPGKEFHDLRATNTSGKIFRMNNSQISLKAFKENDKNKLLKQQFTMLCSINRNLLLKQKKNESASIGQLFQYSGMSN